MLNYFEEKSSLMNQGEWSLNQVICFLIRSFWGKEKIQRGDQRRKNGEDESAKESKCCTVHGWVGK